VTGATLNESKKIIVLSAYTSLLQPFLILFYDYKGNNFLSGNKRKVLVNAPFHQVEGICSENDLKYIISNEKYSQSGFSIAQKINRLDLTEYLGPYVNSLVSITPTLAIKNVTIFPNPASTNVTIMSPAELIGMDYTISDIFGRTILNGQIKSDNTVLELKNIDKGVYIICINNSIFKRLIIK
jgi:hypothetical protein